MNRKTTWLLASLLGMTVIAARSSEMPLQTQWAVLQEPTKADGARRFSDLYSVTWEEIPMPYSTPADRHDIRADSIANDGTIAGTGSDGVLVLWRPDSQTWEWLPEALDPTMPKLISSDGSSVIATDDPYRILTWNRMDGWQALAGSTVTQSAASNVSKNFRFVVGGGRNDGEAPQAWVWSLDGDIQQILQTPIGDCIVAAQAEAVSNDGNVVIGNALCPTEENGFHYIKYIATRWIAGGPPTILHDPYGRELPRVAACNADCSTVFGDGPWFLKSNGEFGFMGNISDGYPWTEDSYGPYHIFDASADGSIVVGLYLANIYPQNPNLEIYDDRPFIWSQVAGMTSLRSLGIWDEDWDIISTVRLSPDGRLLLVAGLRKTWGFWAVVVHLTPNPVRLTGGHSTHAMPTPPRANQGASLRAGSGAVVD
ncbi:MAG: hypothetical protein K8F35_11810 [Dokdonella sp.]|uniref:hypothetical protein n=1 Tax=Dokdonella sp. TaxID=2291710 RepID=UPI0025BA4EB6|nr:hypothetical protein [Dokdonella sp.]MBZ0223702.1 hypothetical protein [Dokdonella sp.]